MPRAARSWEGHLRASKRPSRRPPVQLSMEYFSTPVDLPLSRRRLRCDMSHGQRVSLVWLCRATRSLVPGAQACAYAPERGGGMVIRPGGWRSAARQRRVVIVVAAVLAVGGAVFECSWSMRRPPTRTRRVAHRRRSRQYRALRVSRRLLTCAHTPSDGAEPMKSRATGSSNPEGARARDGAAAGRSWRASLARTARGDPPSPVAPLPPPPRE
jgi:hypothetical protein